LARSGHLASQLGDVEVSGHLRQCGACEVLYSDAGRLGAALSEQAEELPAFDLDELRSEMHATLDSEARSLVAPIRDLPTRFRVGLGAALALASVLVSWGVSRRSDWEIHSSTRSLGVLLILGGTLVLALREFLRPLNELVRDRYRQTLWGVVLALPFFVALSVRASSAELERVGAAIDAVQCLLWGVVFALPMAVWTVFAQRAPIRETNAMWLLAGVLGVVGNLTLHVHCALNDATHLVVGHASLGLLWAAGLWFWYSRKRVVF
jgi:hypothetical protein